MRDRKEKSDSGSPFFIAWQAILGVDFLSAPHAHYSGLYSEVYACTFLRTHRYAPNYSDSFTILGLWVLGLAVSNINEPQLQTFESKTLLLLMPNDIRFLFQYFNSKNLSATVLSKMFFFYSLFLLVEY